MSQLCLIGAGGHGKVVADAARLNDHVIVAYADRQAADWLDVRRLDDDAIAGLPADVALAIGLGGMKPDTLARRLDLVARLRGVRAMPPIIHPGAIIASGSMVADGAVILAGACINPAARIGFAAIINTGALVEHDVVVDKGAHIAPGAIILGGARIGQAAMVGAGAVVLPGAEVPAGYLVKALTRWPQ